MEIRDRYRDYIPVYTDGSQDGNSAACTTVFPSNTVVSMRLSDSASIFTAEIWAIIKDIEEIKYSVASKYIVFTDWLSCLQALQSVKLKYPLNIVSTNMIGKVLLRTNIILSSQSFVCFTFVVCFIHFTCQYLYSVPPGITHLANIEKPVHSFHFCMIFLVNVSLLCMFK